MPESSLHLIGDLGFGADITPTIAHSTASVTHLIPYVNADYGNFFGRVDTFGYRVVPVGYGSLELVTRVLDDGYTPSSSLNGAFAARRSSVPIGVGTLQITPAGAVLMNAFHDVSKSGGNLVDLLFAEEADIGRFSFYPQIGAEYRSANYVRYFYGVSATEAVEANKATYQPGAATNLFVDLFIEFNLGGNWYLNANLRKTRLDKSITDSPLVGRRFSDNGFIAVSYRFE